MMGEQTFWGPDVDPQDRGEHWICATCGEVRKPGDDCTCTVEGINLDAADDLDDPAAAAFRSYAEMCFNLLERHSSAAPEHGRGYRRSHATGKLYYSARWL